MRVSTMGWMLAALLAVGLGVRVAAWLLLPGHSGDVSIMAGWARRMAETGPPGAYDGITSVYPALLYPLWPLGLLLHGNALDLAIKGLSIPFDLALAVLIAVVTRRIASPRAGVAAAALYLFNPAVLLAGPVWGQVDAAGTLTYLGALAASARGRHALAGALGAGAAMLKPQFGLVLLPVLTVAALAAIRARRAGPPARVVLAAVLVYVVLGTPLLLDPVRYWNELVAVANFRSFASLHAMNPWGLLLGFETSERGFTNLGLVLLAAGLAASVAPLVWRRDLPALLASGACVAFAFYFLPTRAHERYLFPAMAVLAPLAVLSVGQLGAYLALTTAFALSLLMTLVDITPFSLAGSLDAVIVSTPAVWAIGLLMMGSALAWVILLWRSVWSRGARAGPVGRPASSPQSRRSGAGSAPQGPDAIVSASTGAVSPAAGRGGGNDRQHHGARHGAAPAATRDRPALPRHSLA